MDFAFAGSRNAPNCSVKLPTCATAGLPPAGGAAEAEEGGVSAAAAGGCGAGEAVAVLAGWGDPGADAVAAIACAGPSGEPAEPEVGFCLSVSALPWIDAVPGTTAGRDAVASHTAVAKPKRNVATAVPRSSAGRYQLLLSPARMLLVRYVTNVLNRRVFYSRLINHDGTRVAAELQAQFMNSCCS